MVSMIAWIHPTLHNFKKSYWILPPTSNGQLRLPVLMTFSKIWRVQRKLSLSTLNGISIGKLSFLNFFPHFFLFRVSGTASGSNSVVLTNSMRNQLIAVLQNQGSTNFTIHGTKFFTFKRDSPIPLLDLFPKYLYLASGSDTRLYDTSTLDSLDIPMFISCNFQYSMVNGTRYWMILSLNSSADYSGKIIAYFWWN